MKDAFLKYFKWKLDRAYETGTNEYLLPFALVFLALVLENQLSILAHAISFGKKN